MGQGDSDVGFFHNASIAREFRTHLWRHVLGSGTGSGPTQGGIGGMGGMGYTPEEGKSDTQTQTQAQSKSKSKSKHTHEPQEQNQNQKDNGKGKGNGKGNGKRLIKVTIVLRTTNRFILNFNEVLQLLGYSDSNTGIGISGSPFEHTLDYTWLSTHASIVMDTLSFKEQVELMRKTDIFIGTHGTVFTNALFMESHSVAIALMQSRHIEFVLPQVTDPDAISYCVM